MILHNIYIVTLMQLHGAVAGVAGEYIPMTYGDVVQENS